MPSTSSISQGKQANLSRRLLFPHLALDDPLPPLLRSSTTGSLDAELYDLIALSLRAFVLPWWSKISKHDREFCPHISRIIVHVLRQLELRLLSSDITPLLLGDLPSILTQHYLDFRNSLSKLHSSYASGGSLSFSDSFHATQFHMAIKPNGAVDDTYIRLALEHVIDKCLPPEDGASVIESSIIREITLDLLQENFFTRLSQPWFWMKLLLQEIGPPKGDGPVSISARPLSFHTLLVIVLSMVQSLSTAALAFVAFTSSLYHIFLRSHSKSAKHKHANCTPLSTRSWMKLLSHALTLRSRHTSSAILSTLEGMETIFSPVIHQLVCSQTSKINEAVLSDLTRRTKHILFPNNGYPAPRPPDPSLEEQAVIRHLLERRLVELGGDFLPSLIIGQTTTSRERTVHDLIEPLSSASSNAHLLLFLFDAIILALFPELGSSPGSNIPLKVLNESGSS